MKLSLTWFLEEFERLVFKLKVFHLRSEQNIPDIQLESYMVIHLLILVEAVCYKLRLFSLFHLGLESIHIYVMGISASLTVIFLLVFICCLVLSYQTKIQQKLPRFIDFSAHLKLVFTRCIYPLLLWSYVYALYQNQHFVVAVSLGTPAVVIGALLIFICDLQLTSTIPTRAFSGALNLRFVFFYSICTSGILVLGVVARNIPTPIYRVLTHLSMVFLAALMGVVAIWVPVFWRTRANQDFMTFSLVILLITAWNLPISLFDDIEINWAIPIISVGFIPKLSGYLVYSQDVINLFDKKTPPQVKLRGLYLLTSLLERSWHGEVQPIEKYRLEEYKHEMRQRATKMGKPEEEVEAAIKRCGRLAQFLAEIGEEYPKSADMAKFELLARLMAPSDNILKAFLSLQRFKRLLGDGILARQETKFFEMMFEARLQAFYFLRPEEKTSQETVIDQLFNNYIINAEQNFNTKVADICLPLNHKTLFLQMTDMIKNAVTKRYDIFRYILSKANSNTHLLTIDLYHLNGKAHTSVRQTRNFMHSEIKAIRMPPSYYYPPQFVLQSLIHHNTLKARKTMRTFKKSLQQWDVIKAREQSLRLDVLDVHSAVLQVSLQQHDRGRIVDATPNWPEMLGEMEDGGSILNHNVNDMFIDILVKKHAIMMNNSFGFTRILNIKRDFYIKAFTGELKAVIFTLRLWPSLEKDLTGVVAIGPSTTQKQGQNMVLLTPNMDIIQAEEGFWTNIGAGDDGEDISNILEITKKLHIVNRLLDIFESFLIDADKFDIEGESGTPLEAIYKIGKVIIRLNNNCSLVYRVDEGTNFSNNLRGTPLMCRLNIVRFMDVVLSQLFIRFGIKELEQQVAGIKKHSTATQTQTFAPDSFGNIDGFPKKQPSIDTIDDIGDKAYFALNAMTLKEKLKVWNEEEKPTDVDLVLIELFKWVGKADEQDVRLCPFALKKYLVQFGEIVNEYKGSFDRTRTEGSALTRPTVISKSPDPAEVAPEEEIKQIAKPKGLVRIGTKKIAGEPKMMVKNVVIDEPKDEGNTYSKISTKKFSDGVEDQPNLKGSGLLEAKDSVQYPKINVISDQSSNEEAKNKEVVIKSEKDYIMVGVLDDGSESGVDRAQNEKQIEDEKVDEKFNELFGAKTKTIKTQSEHNRAGQTVRSGSKSSKRKKVDLTESADAPGEAAADHDERERVRRAHHRHGRVVGGRDRDVHGDERAQDAHLAEA